jgi:hypothetical protein
MPFRFLNDNDLRALGRLRTTPIRTLPVPVLARVGTGAVSETSG